MAKSEQETVRELAGELPVMTAAEAKSDAAELKQYLASAKLDPTQRKILEEHLNTLQTRSYPESAPGNFKPVKGNPVATTSSAPAPSQSSSSSPSNIDTLAAQNIERNNVAATALSNLYNQAQNTFQAATRNLAGVADDSSLVRTTAELAQADAIRKTQEAATAFGTNPNAASYAMERLIAQSSQLLDRQLATAKEVEDIHSNVFTSFLETRLFKDQTSKKLAAITAQKNAVDSQMKNLHDLTQEAAQTNMLIAGAKTTETAMASGRIAAAEVNQKVATLELDAIKTNVQGITQIAALKNNNMDIALRARDQQLQEDQAALARQNAAIQSQSLILAMQERQDRVDLKQEEIKTREHMLSVVNLGRQVNGGLPPFKSYQEMATAAKMDKNLEQQISSQYVAGLTASQTGAATLANDPYSAIKYVKQTGAQLDAGRSKVINFLDRVSQVVAKDPNIKKEADLVNGVNAKAKAEATNFHSNITSGENNIYAPPPVTSLLSDQEFKNTFIAQQILAPLQQGGVEELSPKMIVSSLLTGVKEGKIRMDDAERELGFMAEKIVGYNNSMYRYKDTAGLPNMDAVNVPLDATGSFANVINTIAGPGTPGYSMPVSRAMYGLFGGESESIVNLRDPVARSEYLNKQMALIIPPVLRQQAAVQQTQNQSGRTASGKVGGN